MKFNLVIGNPPYQELKEGNRKSKAMWPLFVKQRHEASRQGGIPLDDPSARMAQRGRRIRGDP